MVKVWTLMRLALVLLLILVLLTAVLWLLQRRLIYFPDRSAPPPGAEVLHGAQDITLNTVDGLGLAAWLITPHRERRTSTWLCW
jgi:hypothetical protein